MTTTAQRLFSIQEKQAQRAAQFEGSRDIRLGNIIEVDGSIEGSRDGFVWFKSLENATPPREVFNPGYQGLRSGMICYIEQSPKQPARWQIIQVNTGIYFDDQSTYETLPGANLAPHAASHEWPAGRPGSDVMTIYPRAISDFAVRPTSPASMKVRVYGGWYSGATNYERFSGPTNTKDFTSDVPGTSGQARIVAITVDSTGTLGYTNGSTFVDGLPVPAASWPSVSRDVTIISAVRLVNGMTTITEANFDREIRPLFGKGGDSNLWTDKGGGAGIYYDGNVGIGDYSATAIPYPLSVDGTGTLVQVGDGSGSVGLNFDGSDGDVRDMVFLSGGSPRWILRVDDTAESGSNVGSDLNIIRRNDAGGNLGSALYIERSTGYVGLGTTSSPPGRLTVEDTGGGATPHIRLRDASATRYRADLDVLASGAGLSINAYDDTGAAYLPIQIDGSKTVLGVQGNVSVGSTTDTGRRFSVFNTGDDIFQLVGAFSRVGFAEATDVTTTPVVLIRNDAYDVTTRFIGFVVVVDTDGNDQANTIELDHAGVTNYSFIFGGGSTWRFRLNADGSIDLTRTAGSATGYGAIFGLWI